MSALQRPATSRRGAGGARALRPLASRASLSRNLFWRREKASKAACKKIISARFWRAARKRPPSRGLVRIICTQHGRRSSRARHLACSPPASLPTAAATAAAAVASGGQKWQARACAFLRAIENAKRRRVAASRRARARTRRRAFGRRHARRALHFFLTPSPSPPPPSPPPPLLLRLIAAAYVKRRAASARTSSPIRSLLPNFGGGHFFCLHSSAANCRRVFIASTIAACTFNMRPHFCCL